VRENISQEEVESPILPTAMTTSNTKNANILQFDEILNVFPQKSGNQQLIQFKSPDELGARATVAKNGGGDSSECRSDFQIQE
jgi:hypothetical protein